MNNRKSGKVCKLNKGKISSNVGGNCLNKQKARNDKRKPKDKAVNNGESCIAIGK